MPNFKYTAKDLGGKTVGGALEAPNRNAAVETLRKKDLVIISLDEASGKFNLMSLL